MRKIFLFIITFIWLLNGINAQHIRFRRITSEDGIMGSMVNAITQDSAGFMWFGCSGGLCRYDGKNFLYFRHNAADTSTIDEGLVSTLLYDADGYIWAGGSGCGLVKINCKTQKLEKLSKLDSISTIFLPSYSVKSLKLYKQFIYIATLDAGIWEYNKKSKQFKKMFATPDMPFISSRGIDISADGILWIATGSEGLLKYNLNTKQLETFNESNTSGENLVYNKVRNVFVDKDGWVWLSFWNAGNAVLMKGETKFISNTDKHPYFGELLKIGLVSQFLNDYDGNIWLCTAESGAVRFNKKSKQIKKYKNSLGDIESIGDNTVLSAYQDNTGAIWFGTWKGGAQVVNPHLNQFGLYKPSDNELYSLHNASTTCFTQLKSGKVLIGTGDGISEFDTQKNTFIRFDYDSIQKKNILQNAHIYSIAEDKNENVWVTVFGSGIFVFNKKRELIKRYVDDENGGLSSQIINKILITKAGKIYASSSSLGLNIYDAVTDKFQFIQHSKEDSTSLGSDEIRCMLEGKNEQIWIGTEHGGLNLFNPKNNSFKRFLHNKNNSKSILGNKITALCYDKTGALWVGTNMGICRYSETNNTFTNYSHYDELLQSEIFSIIEDKKGNLWLTTSNGFICFNPLNGNIKMYDKYNGLHGSEFIHDATYMLKDKRICVGGISGFNIFHPSEVTTFYNSANVVFTNYSILNKPVKSKPDLSNLKEITLSYKDYFFSFNFSLLDFTNPANNTYAYKLEGFNSDWVNIGTANSVTFTNLSHGTYTLKVKAANSMGEWSSKQAKLKITIIPPFWKTWWFYSLCVLAVVLAFYFFIRYREKKLKSEKLKLEIKVEERTKELKQEKIKVEEAHKDIKDSITYAKRIQDAMLPTSDFMERHMLEHFVLYKPKDIISGDFYWTEKLGNILYFAAADCTGHGVPGAMVSVVCSNALYKTVVELGISEPGAILDMVRKIVVQTFEKSDKDVKDGMDISLCKLEIKENNINTLLWAGANNPLFIIRPNTIASEANTVIASEEQTKQSPPQQETASLPTVAHNEENEDAAVSSSSPKNKGVSRSNSNYELLEYKPNKQPIGKVDNPLPFTTHSLNVFKGDAIYIFTDGFADQFGGENNKKYMIKKLKNLLLQIAHLPMHEQEQKLAEEFNAWKGSNEQVDDVCVIGVKI